MLDRMFEAREGSDKPGQVLLQHLTPGQFANGIRLTAHQPSPYFARLDGNLG